MTVAPAATQRAASWADFVCGDRQVRGLGPRGLGPDNRGGENARPRAADGFTGQRGAAQRGGDDAGTAGATDQHRLAQQLGGAAFVAVPDQRGDDLVRGKAHLQRGPAPADDLAARLDEIAGEYRGQELDAVVGPEQPLIAVGADAQLGGDIAEQRQQVGTVD